MSASAKFAYTGSNSAPKGAPIRVLGGDFLTPDGTGGAYIPAAAAISPGWGTPRSIYTGDDTPSPVPDRVTVSYFSYLEDKFYQGEFALPRDSIARLLAEEYPTQYGPTKRGRFDMLIAGMAPGGAVAVWLAGPERHVEVFFGQAQVADVDFHRATGAPSGLDRRQFVADVLAEESAADPLVDRYRQHFPVGLWAAYRTRYRWTPAFEGVPLPAQLDPLQYFNGERGRQPVPFTAQVLAAGLPVPSYLAFDDRAAGLSYEITFDFDETAAALARVGAAVQPGAGAGAPAELVFAKTPAGPARAEVRVRRGTESVTLRAAKVEVFRLRR